MARAALSGSELVADLSAWLAKITARLTGSSALSRAVCNTSPNIRDCEFHVIDDWVFMLPNEKLTLPHLHTLNIRVWVTILNIFSAINTPSL
jgi:hypothetical protein